ncbi:hypothetical protein QVD17_25770 [Tagetes erecta]|uniref:Uncharacterized protein n=1 Tax=Tagetes erecta TaxID=13708 RepID=A0AAD8NHZ5_TARER|nr:hypothetical protein QVD17_25770 [Tagetes erecta]
MLSTIRRRYNFESMMYTYGQYSIDQFYRDYGIFVTSDVSRLIKIIKEAHHPTFEFPEIVRVWGSNTEQIIKEAHHPTFEFPEIVRVWDVNTEQNEYFAGGFEAISNPRTRYNVDDIDPHDDEASSSESDDRITVDMDSNIVDSDIGSSPNLQGTSVISIGEIEPASSPDENESEESPNFRGFPTNMSNAGGWRAATRILGLETSMRYIRGAHGDISNSGKCILYIALYTIALGAGGIKSNASRFGSDQFDESNPKELKAMGRFFNIYFLCISSGSLFAITILMYVQEKLSSHGEYGIFICAVVMIITLVLLLHGERFYRNKKPQGSALTVVWRVLYQAWMNRKLSNPDDLNLLADHNSSKIPHTNTFRYLEKAAIRVDKGDRLQVTTINDVEDVKTVIKLIPMWATCILFWTIDTQMDSFTIEQAAIMNRAHGKFKIPSSSYSVCLYLSTIMFTFLYEHVFVRISINHDRKGLTCLQKAGVGLVFSVVGMVAAAVCEKKRKEFALVHGVNIRAYWLAPQLFLLGAGEAFSFGQFEFFNQETPKALKSLSTVLFLSTMAMGYYLSSLLVCLTNITTNGNWLNSNLNQGNLDKFYWMLVVLGVFNLIAFFYVASRHKYNTKQCDRAKSGSKTEINATNVENV